MKRTSVIFGIAAATLLAAQLAPPLPKLGGSLGG